MTRQSLLHIALVVRDYDEALAFYCGKLGFDLIEDTYQPEQDKRWVVVAPPGSSGSTILLARASKPEQERFIGDQAGGRVFLFLKTDDFDRDYTRYRSRNRVCASINTVRLRQSCRFQRPVWQPLGPGRTRPGPSARRKVLTAMALEVWLLYATTVLAFMVTPGPSHLLMLSNAMSHGFHRSLATAAGDLTANALQMLAAGIGLAALLVASQGALTIVKWAGVAYLIWMGLRMWLRASATAQGKSLPRRRDPKHSGCKAFLRRLPTRKLSCFLPRSIRSLSRPMEVFGCSSSSCPQPIS